MDRNTMLLRMIATERNRCSRVFRGEYDQHTWELLRKPVDINSFDYKGIVVLMDKLISAGFTGPWYKLVDSLPTRFKYGELEVGLGVSIDYDAQEIYVRAWSCGDEGHVAVCVAMNLMHADGTCTCSDVNIHKLLFQ